jgi:uncharacterized radical SAM superfamily Fe-S cluster-containing enzyme
VVWRLLPTCITGGKKQAERIKDLTVAEVIKRLEEAEVGKGTTEVYSGGETTIYKDILYLIRYASEKGAKVRLLTNCIKFADFDFALQAEEAWMTGVATNKRRFSEFSLEQKRKYHAFIFKDF